MIKVAAALTAALALAACAGGPGQTGQNLSLVANSPDARECLTMGYRLGTAEHAYCMEVMGRRLTPEEYN